LHNRELLKLAGFGVAYATLYKGFSFADVGKLVETPLFALRGTVLW